MSDYALQLSDAEIARYRFMAEAAARDEREAWTAAGVTEGARVADVGCGPGAVSAALAGIVGPSGTVYAIDSDPHAVALGRRAAREAGVSNVVFAEGAATATGWSPESVDVVMLRHVLAHNGGQEQAIVDHLATLVRPGGCVYLVDVDLTAMRIRPPEAATGIADLADRYAEFHARLGNDLSVGLRLGELLSQAGLEQVNHRGRYQILRPPAGMRPPAWAARDQMLAAGVIDDADIDRWQAEFEELGICQPV